MTQQPIEPAETVEEALDKAMNWTKQFTAIDELARQGHYTEATQVVEFSTLPIDTKERLNKALGTNEPNVIREVFRDYAGRLGSAFCEPCWQKGEQ